MSAFPAIPKEVAAPLGKYCAVVIARGLGFVSGQFPVDDGTIVFTGRIGAELDEWQGREAAALAAANVLGQLRRALGARYPRVRLLRVDGYVASAPGFVDQAQVLDGASDTFVHHLGERGFHVKLSPQIAEAVTNELAKQLQKLTTLGHTPVVLCSPQVRAGLKQITSVAMPKLVVMSLNEVTRDTAVEPHGQVPLNIVRQTATTKMSA